MLIDIFMRILLLHVLVSGCHPNVGSNVTVPPKGGISLISQEKTVMECVNHPGISAAGSCQICGKALCADCMNRFNPPLCEPCLLSHNAGIAKRLIFDIGLTVGLFLVVVITLTVKNPAYFQGSLVWGVMLSCAYWGWLFLSRAPVPIVFTSAAGLGAYFCIKVVLSIFIGFIAAPIQIFRRAKSLYSIRALKQQIEQGKA